MKTVVIRFGTPHVFQGNRLIRGTEMGGGISFERSGNKIARVPRLLENP